MLEGVIGERVLQDLSPAMEWLIAIVLPIKDWAVSFMVEVLPPREDSIARGASSVLRFLPDGHGRELADQDSP
jgi:hypothetical protein